MTVHATAQGTQTPVPPIPKMEAGPAGAPSRASEIRDAIRQAVKDAKTEALQAKADAKQAQVDAKKAAADAKASGTQPVLAQSTVPPPAFPNIPDDIPPQVMNAISMFFTFVVVLVLGTPLVRMFVRRFDRKTQALQANGPDLTPQLRQLQESVDAMAIEVERISEGQRFTSKLLAERSAALVGATDKKASG